MPLQFAEIYFEASIPNLNFLRGAPLTHLAIGAPMNGDLSPLHEMPLQFLRLISGKTDVKMLRDLPLETLILEKCTLDDLSPLEGLPLKTLTFDQCKGITDLRPLAKLTRLERLVIPGGEFDLEPLRSLPTLKRLGRRLIAGTGLPAQTAAEFWKEYDAQKGTAPK
jgi:hypothetical protein